MKNIFLNGRLFNAVLAALISAVFFMAVVVTEQVTRPPLMTDTELEKAEPAAETTVHRLSVLLGGQLPGGLVQGFTVFLFVFGLLEVKRAGDRLKRERASLHWHLLPEQEYHLLFPGEVEVIQKEMFDREKKGARTILIETIKKTAARYLANHSASEAQDALKDLNEIHARRLESEHDPIRYLNWAIPMCGFGGTVLGMAGALRYLAELKDQGITDELTQQLYLAYDTTIVGIVLSMILMALYHNLTAEMDKLLADIQDFVLENFVNRLRLKRDASSIALPADRIQ